MKIKKLSILLFCFFLSTTCFALDVAVGVQCSWFPRFTNEGIHVTESEAAITFKIPSVPIIFSTDVILDGYKFEGLQLAGDWWFKNKSLKGELYYYYGLGGAVSVRFPNLSFYDFEIGARGVAGLNIYIYEPLEVYIQCALQPSLAVYSDRLGFSMPTPLSLGLRYWF